MRRPLPQASTTASLSTAKEQKETRLVKSRFGIRKQTATITLLSTKRPLIGGEGVGCAFGALDCFPTIHIGGALDGNLQLAETGERLLIYPVSVG